MILLNAPSSAFLWEVAGIPEYDRTLWTQREIPFFIFKVRAERHRKLFALIHNLVGSQAKEIDGDALGSSGMEG